MTFAASLVVWLASIYQYPAVVYPGDMVRVEDIRSHGGQREWNSFLDAVHVANNCPDDWTMHRNGKTWHTMCATDCDRR